MVHPEIVNSVTDFYLNKIGTQDALILFDEDTGLDGVVALERGDPRKIALLLHSYLLQNPDVLDTLLQLASRI